MILLSVDVLYHMGDCWKDPDFEGTVCEAAGADGTILGGCAGAGIRRFTMS